MASLFAITLCHNICNFWTVCGKFSARHNPLPAKPPPRHNFFQLLAPAGGLEIFLWRVTLVFLFQVLRIVHRPVLLPRSLVHSDRSVRPRKTRFAAAPHLRHIKGPCRKRSRSWKIAQVRISLDYFSRVYKSTKVTDFFFFAFVFFFFYVNEHQLPNKAK